MFENLPTLNGFRRNHSVDDMAVRIKQVVIFASSLQLRCSLTD